MSAFQAISETRSVAFASSMDHIGLSILVAISLLSFLAVFGLILAIMVSAANTWKSDNRSLFVRSHVSAYFFCLLICWILQCLGSSLSIRWLQDGMATSGSLCTAQGLLKHIADVGVAVWTTVIAIHTFCILFLEINMSKYALWIILTVGWLFIFFMVVPGPLFIQNKEEGPFYDVTGHWCWISPAYALESILLGHIIMFLAAFVSTPLYILTFFRLRGNIVRDGWKLSFRFLGPDESGKYFNDQTQLVAKQMLLYPLTYAILITPMAVIQFVLWSGKEVNFEWVVFSGSVYMLSGLLNVVLFTTTRRILPSSSLRLGNWYLVPSSRGASYGPSYDKAEKGASKTVTFAAETTILCTPPGRRDTKRPPALVLTHERDSMASMYSAREGVYLGPLSSHWSPDTPPLHKVSRLSLALENMTAIAQKI